MTGGLKMVIQLKFKTQQIRSQYVKRTKKTFHTGSVKKSTTINVPSKKVWRKISNIAGLPSWVMDVKETIYLSKNKKNVGAVRLITLADNSKIEEHIVAWKQGEYFTYVATEGLPLRAYVATISLKKKSRNKTEVTWQSYLNSKKMSEIQFLEFLAFIGTFYESSLEKLKKILEK